MCNNMCFTKLEERELPKASLIQTKPIVQIQSCYRGHLVRMNLKKTLFRKSRSQIKKKTSVKRETETIICFRENSDFYFKFKQQYDFSFTGLKQVIKDVNNFYSTFFKFPTDSNKESPPNSPNSPRQIFSRTMIERLTSAKEFQTMFKLYFFSILNTIFDIGDIVKNIETTIFKIEKIKEDKKHNSSTDLKSVIDTKENIITKIIIINIAEPYFTRVISQIVAYEKEHCTINTFKDEKNVNYHGSLKENTHIKWGVGREFYIDDDELKSKEENIKYRYYGYFKQGLYHGIGMLIKENGDCYYGEFRDGKKNGFGFLYSLEFSYRGFFYNNHFEGYGEFAKENLYYCGSFSKGAFDGFGYLETEQSNICVGAFKEGKVEGDAWYKWESGESYYGSWRKGMMHGFGEFKWKSGDKYIGNYENDLKNGKGRYVFNNGSELRGSWVKGRKEGEFKVVIREMEETKSVKKGEYVVCYVNDEQVI